MTKTVIITGANSGLGFETTKQIVEKGPDYQVVMACRNLQKAKTAREEILQTVSDANLICLELDTSSLAKVRDFVTTFKQLETPLYGLVCNAGIGSRNVHQTADGFNHIFETNYLGHFLLTQLLLPLMTTDGRIVTVSSERHDTPLRGVAWPGAETLAYPGRDPLVDRQSYSFSKLCLILFSYQLDRDLKAAGKKIAVNTVNPGLMPETGLMKHGPHSRSAALARFANIMGTAKGSGEMITNLMCSPEFAQGSAKYYDRSSTKPVVSSKLSYDQQAQHDLWNFSVKAVGLTE
ncbi:short-chain dehydrogenase/oxidoreductase [Secundilactobacillus pentosiphilus]|uniref:Short-chain dehydrogenase/oxidoreductase n=1 Tax=Secundilactobacillus pentosiphilus TaxID=1714682 RepID=A0A1Z5IL29_9LACO|nr:SDR family NAD(P)-dependent oxidoreductase [Secundilactobacillus pentosiphilus]GAX02475.1 short-chain dehydrogenase/oxidoreductase [Secundilactobacillus pentosiphilus]